MSSGRSKTQIRRRRLEVLERRVEFLNARIAAQPEGLVPHFDLAETGAMRWAVSCLESAIELDQIEALEKHGYIRDRGMDFDEEGA
jgi:predicted component of type VI protein secretion system